MKRTYKKPETQLVAVKSQQMICLSMQQEKADESEVLGREIDYSENNGWAQRSSVWDD